MVRRSSRCQAGLLGGQNSSCSALPAPSSMTGIPLSADCGLPVPGYRVGRVMVLDTPDTVDGCRHGSWRGVHFLLGPKEGILRSVLTTNLTLSVLFFFFSVSVASSCLSVSHFLKGRSETTPRTKLGLSALPLSLQPALAWLLTISQAHLALLGGFCLLL